MANIPKMSVKFRTRHKNKEEYENFFRIPFYIIVSYNRKQLAISCAFRSRVIPSWEVFQQLNSDGQPKDPDTQDPKVLKCAERMQKTKRIYLATLEKAINEGVWEDMTTEKFIRYLLDNRDEVDKVVRYRRKW